MASTLPPKKNTAYVFYVSLVSQADVKILQANPTLAAGDVKVAIDDGAPANITTLPTVDGDFTKRVKVSLSADEMNGDHITLIFADAAGAEWCDLSIDIETTARTLDDGVKLADGVPHGGTPGSSTATMALERLWVVSPTNDALYCEAQASGKTGITGYGSHSLGNGAIFSGGVKGCIVYGSDTGMEIFADVGRGLNAGTYTSGPGIEMYSPDEAALKIQSDDGHGISITATGSGKRAIMLDDADGGLIDGDFAAFTESYAADGATVKLSQALYEILAFLEERNVSGTTMTLKKRDGSTTAFTVTLNSATQPTATTRAT